MIVASFALICLALASLSSANEAEWLWQFVHGEDEDNWGMAQQVLRDGNELSRLLHESMGHGEGEGEGEENTLVTLAPTPLTPSPPTLTIAQPTPQAPTPKAPTPAKPTPLQSTPAVSTGEPTPSPGAVVSVTNVTIEGVDYDLLVASPWTYAAFIASIKEAFAQEDDRILEDHVMVEVAKGSVVAIVTIAPGEINAMLVATLLNNSPTLEERIRKQVSEVEDIEAVSSGIISVAVGRVVTVEITSIVSATSTSPPHDAASVPPVPSIASDESPAFPSATAIGVVAAILIISICCVCPFLLYYLCVGKNGKHRWMLPKGKDQHCKINVAILPAEAHSKPHEDEHDLVLEEMRAKKSNAAEISGDNLTVALDATTWNPVPGAVAREELEAIEIFDHENSDHERLEKFGGSSQAGSANCTGGTAQARQPTVQVPSVATSQVPMQASSAPYSMSAWKLAVSGSSTFQITPMSPPLGSPPWLVHTENCDTALFTTPGAVPQPGLARYFSMLPSGSRPLMD